MGKPTGFMEYDRVDSEAFDPKERIKNFNEFHTPLSPEKQRIQAARCMDCGVPFCQSGKMLKGMISGCPLNNLIPEWNELLYLGNYKRAYHRLAKTSNFPEFTSRVCPGLCEKACTCGLNGDAVTTKENEKQLLNMLLSMVTLSLKSLLCAPEKSCRNRFRSFGTCSSGPS